MILNDLIYHADSESLVKKYPFMKRILSLEGFYSKEDIVVLEGIINSELLERPSHYTKYRSDDGLPAYRIFSENPLMPDKEGPVPTYAVQGETIKKLGLEYQLVDKEYIEDDYDAEVRLNPYPLSIKKELSLKHVENPDYIVCRDRKVNQLKFDVYRKE